MKDDPQKSIRSMHRLSVLKIGVAVILFPLLPLAVGTNFLNASDWLSPLPGITSGGGAISALATIVYISSIIGIVVTGGVATSGGDIPGVGQSEPTPSSTSTPTQTPFLTQTPTTTSTPTTTPTPSEAELRQEYEHVREEYLEKWPRNPDQYPTVPELLGTEVRVDQDSFWVVFDETDVFENASRMRDEWTAVSNAYLHALNNHTGQAPDRMVAVGWNNTGPITYFRVETDDGRAYLNGNVNYSVYYNRYFRTIRQTNDAERSIARDIAEHPPDDN